AIAVQNSIFKMRRSKAFNGQKPAKAKVHLSLKSTLKLEEREWLLGKLQNPLAFPHKAAFGVFPNQTQMGQRPTYRTSSVFFPSTRWV
ncbi:hypothetical protein ACQP3F_31620, partial [Escherichia coli]